MRGGGRAAGDSNLEEGETWRGEERARPGRPVSVRRGREGSGSDATGRGLGGPGRGWGWGWAQGQPSKGRPNCAPWGGSTQSGLLRAGVNL